MSTKVLVADDESDYVELISFNLKQRGYEVFTAYNGFETLSQARKEVPDVIVLDVRMPGIDGFSVCAILRSESLTGSIPILMYTALAGEIPRLNEAKAAADDYLIKPFGIQELLGRVERLSRLRKANAAPSTEAKDKAG